MNKHKILGYLQSFVAIPMLAVAAPLTGVATIPAPIVIQSPSTAVDASVITAQEAEAAKEKKDAETLDAYFASYNSPLEGYGTKFVQEAKKNNIDWRLLPAIAMRESTGGKQACKSVSNSVFGYGSCKISFKSIDQSIEVVAASLGGNNLATARHYSGKTPLQVLRKYNSVIVNYPWQVKTIMLAINDEEAVK